MKTITSHTTAYEVATEMDATMQIGETWGFNVLNITRVADGEFSVAGKAGTFHPAELADFVLYPERARVNDWLRTYKIN